MPARIPHSRAPRFVRGLALSAAVFAAAPLLAQPAPAAEPAAGAPTDIETSKYTADGTLSRAEFVRALPGEKFYATMRLEKGAKVTVTGAKGEWLKIAPPEGSFSYVNRAFVERFGNGKQGRVTATNLLVKAGSSLQPVMWITQGKLNPKDVVEILGEDDQYYKIRPPEGAFLYLPKDAVIPAAPAVSAAPEVAPPAPAPIAPAAPPAIGPDTPAVEAPDGPVATVTPTTPATRPAGPIVTAPPEVVVEPEVTPDAAASTLTANEALVELQALEARFAEASQKPLPQQPLAELVSSYERIGATSGMNDAAKRVVEIRLATLKVRQEGVAHMRETQAREAAARQKQMDLAAEREELENQYKKVEIQRFTAVGQLRMSSLQVARTTLYRLTDPATGRTLAYVWGTDPKIATLVDQFVGVKGAIQTDPRLQFKVINPASSEALNPQQIHTAYAAELVPPSLAPKSTTATVTPE